MTRRPGMDPKPTGASTEGASPAQQHSKSAESPQSEQASRWLAAIIESSDDAIVSKDLNGIVTSWNKSAERMFGYTAAEMVGRPITTITPPELQPEEPDIMSKIRAGEKIDHFQTVRVRKDGQRNDVSLSISPIKDDQGRVTGAAMIARDITQQKRAERASLLLAAIVESSDDAIVSKDLNGTITSWNQGAERIFGYKAHEIIGRPITTIIPPELHSDEERILAKIRAGDTIDHFQTVRVKKDGECIEVSLTISPVKDQNGKIVGAAKIGQDITQQKKLEAALHTGERLASVGRLAATIAHEINNPLEAVTNFIYLARQQPDLPEKILRYLNSADHELRRVAHLAQQTLGFYRDNSQPAPVGVAEVIDDVVSLYERKIKYKGLTLERRIQPGLTVWTLEGELKQVMSNLIANAIDASRDGGKLVIRARAARNSSSGREAIRITVADNGFGISDKDKPKIFAPFFTTKKALGTGLGLWITKDLLEKQGGTIRFRSSVAQPSGTVMVVCLPDKPPQGNAELVA